MKKHNKYYEVISKRAWDETHKSEKKYGKKWWDSNSIDDSVNNMPIIENKTGINSSEWVIIHRSLIMTLIDYVNNHPLENEVNSYSMELNFKTGEWKTYLNDLQNFIVDIPDSDVEYSFNTYQCVDDEKVINSYDGLTKIIADFLNECLEKYASEIGVEITKMYFSMDNIGESLRVGKWSPETDSTFSLYNGDDLIVCSM